MMTPVPRWSTLALAAFLSACSVQTEDKKTSAPAGANRPAVVLVADLGEADSECGCGQIIRLVREASRRGVVVREIDPAKEPNGGREYGVVVAPSVVLLDGDGKVARRLVGEDADTIAALREALSALKSKSGT